MAAPPAHLERLARPRALAALASRPLTAQAPILCRAGEGKLQSMRRLGASGIQRMLLCCCAVPGVVRWTRPFPPRLGAMAAATNLSFWLAFSCAQARDVTQRERRRAADNVSHLTLGAPGVPAPSARSLHLMHASRRQGAARTLSRGRQVWPVPTATWEACMAPDLGIYWVTRSLVNNSQPSSTVGRQWIRIDDENPM